MRRILLILTLLVIFSGTAFAGYNEAIIALARGNKDVAYKELKPLAEAGDMNSQFLLGLMYDKDGNNKTAMGWYKKAAAQGDTRAQQILDMTEAYK